MTRAHTWEQLSHQEIVTVLAQAQRGEQDVICGGCGRMLEREFMELDHINPKSSRGPDHILNRILLCQPCNRRKRHMLTLPGLEQKNRQEGWMQDPALARRAQERAHAYAEWVKEHHGTAACRALTEGRRQLAPISLSASTGQLDSAPLPDPVLRGRFARAIQHHDLQRLGHRAGRALMGALFISAALVGFGWLMGDPGMGLTLGLGFLPFTFLGLLLPSRRTRRRRRRRW